MSQSQSNLSSKKLSLRLSKPLYLHQVSKELTPLDKLHQEVNAELILKHELHIDEERMLYRKEDLLFQFDIVNLIVLYDDILADTLHRIQIACAFLLNQIHLPESTLPYHPHYLEILEKGIAELSSLE